jgi:hypothetical protein
MHSTGFGITAACKEGFTLFASSQHFSVVSVYIRAVGVPGQLRLVQAPEAFGEVGVEAGGADAGRDAVTVGRKLGVVLL